jgi:DNA-binding NarL/FixJ family response regulator
MSRQTRSARDPLTAAEWRVVRLLQSGLSNRSMAGRLVVSRRTVESHLSSALAKTGCCNRVELLLWSLEPGNGPPAAPDPERGLTPDRLSERPA